MKKTLVVATVLLTVGFGISFANPNPGDQERSVSEQKPAEDKVQKSIDRLNKDLSNIPQSMKDCIFNAATIEQLNSCHNSK